MAARILHSADLHLGGPVASPEPEISRSAAKARGHALENLVRGSIAHGVDLALLAGDVFHSADPPLSARWALHQACLDWTKAGVKVFIAPGNHDPWEKDSVWSQWEPPDGVKVFREPEGIALAELGLWVAGAGHQTRHEERDLAALLPTPPEGLNGVAVLHCDLPGHRNTDAHQPYAPAKLGMMRESSFTVWALGHWHAGRLLSAAPYVAYPGTHQGGHFAETGPHGANLLTLNGRQVEVEPLTSSVQDFFRLNLDGLAEKSDLAALTAMIASSLKSLGYRSSVTSCLDLKLQGPCPLWKRFTGLDHTHFIAELGSALGAASLALDASGLRPPLNPAALAEKPHVLGRMLSLLNSLESDPELMADLARELKPQLNPLALSGKSASELIRDIIPAVSALAMRDLNLDDADKEDQS